MKCATCPRQLSPHAILDTCPRCRSVFRYWRHPSRGVSAITRRLSQLTIWQDRMEYLGGTERVFAKAARIIHKSRANGFIVPAARKPGKGKGVEVVTPRA